MKIKHLLLVSLMATVAGSSAHAITVVDTTPFPTLPPTGKFNLQNSALIARGNPFAQIYGYVVSGYNGGTWDGFGIWSSVAAADPDQIKAVGCISNAEAGYASFYGHATAAGTEVFALGSYYGDANLDGLVNAADYALITLGGTDWYHGDFNYDGVVDAADLTLINHTVVVLAAPEPGSAALLGLGALLLAARRRREM